MHSSTTSNGQIVYRSDDTRNTFVCCNLLRVAHHLWCFPAWKLEKFLNFPLGAPPLGSISVFLRMLPRCLLHACAVGSNKNNFHKVPTHKRFGQVCNQKVIASLSFIAPLHFPFVFLQSRELQLLLFLEVGSCNLLELCTWLFLLCFLSCRTFSDLWFINNNSM